MPSKYSVLFKTTMKVKDDLEAPRVKALLWDHWPIY